jgi:hypothetical protein
MDLFIIGFSVSSHEPMMPRDVDYRQARIFDRLAETSCTI